MLFTRLLSTSIRLPWGVQLSIYTAPMYFMAFISIIGLILIIIGFDGKMDKPHKPHGDEDNGVSNKCDQKWAIKSKVQLGTSPIDAEKAHLEIVPSSDGEFLLKCHLSPRIFCLKFPFKTLPKLKNLKLFNLIGLLYLLVSLHAFVFVF